MSLIKLEEKDESPLVNAFKSVTALSKSESECISRNKSQVGQFVCQESENKGGEAMSLFW